MGIKTTRDGEYKMWADGQPRISTTAWPQSCPSCINTPRTSALSTSRPSSNSGAITQQRTRDQRQNEKRTAVEPARARYARLLLEVRQHAQVDRPAAQLHRLALFQSARQRDPDRSRARDKGTNLVGIPHDPLAVRRVERCHKHSVCQQGQDDFRTGFGIPGQRTDDGVERKNVVTRHEVRGAQAGSCM